MVLSGAAVAGLRLLGLGGVLSCCGAVGVCAGCAASLCCSSCGGGASVLLPSGWGVSSDVAAVVVSAVGLWLWCFLLSGFRCRAAVGRVVVAAVLVASAGGASAGALLRLSAAGCRFCFF